MPRPGADRPRGAARGEHGPVTTAGGRVAAGARVHRAGGGRLRGGERRGPGRWARSAACASCATRACTRTATRWGSRTRATARGILWALAIGALLEDASRKLECFRGVGAATLQGAAELIARGAADRRGRAQQEASCTWSARSSGPAGWGAPCSSASTRASSASSGTARRCRWTSSPGADETAAARALGRVAVVRAGDRRGARRRPRRPRGPAARGGVQPGDRRARVVAPARGVPAPARDRRAHPHRPAGRRPASTPACRARTCS